MQEQKIIDIESHKSKKRKNKVLIYILIILFMISIIYFYKKYDLGDRFLNLLQINKDFEKDNTIIFDSVGKYKFDSYKDGVVLLCKSGLKGLNKQGEEEWGIDVYYNDPFLQVNNKYILIADKGGKEANIISNGNIISTIHSEDPIIFAKISKAGNTAILTSPKGYKGKITIYNLKGEELFKWFSGENYIVDVDISEDGGRMAIATIDTTQGKVAGGVVFFYLNQEKPYAGNIIDNTIISNVKFCKDNTLIAIGDNQLIGFSLAGAQEWSFDYGGKTLQTYDIDKSQLVVLALSEYEETGIFDNKTIIEIINYRGKNIRTYPVEGEIKYIKINNDHIAFNNKRDISIINTKGSLIANTIYNKDVKDIVLYDNKKSMLLISRNSADIIDYK